ncbi:MATE efflux family protein [Leptospira broomii serovar Hurstbridge str. 5399]|uniref:Multidrug-efflux transporter n=1 Tax=Leptospira broomii serovar Hurstbridge str. 5399 TaxID=1049789 RepID=T0F8D3_9LEPT|nr:MATE family efflux transporter [Leptospira broomii]EQA44166.1 MATE efflux family protein [Leptospira broomii serovar Hurstbridge str. 5399]
MDTLLKKIRRTYRFSRLNTSILFLAVPVVLAMISQTVVWSTDSIMVGYLGKEALAAIGMGGISYYTLVAFLIGFSMGIQIIVARRFGEGRSNEIGKIGITTLYLSLFLGVIITVLGPFISSPLMALIGADKAVSLLGESYLTYRFLGSGFYFIGFCFRGFMDGLGFTKAGFVSMAVTTLSNILLNWIFIYGNCGVPAMGIAGAGLASSLAGLVGLLVFPFFLFKYKANRYFLGIRPIPTWTHLLEIIRVGVPPGLEEGFVNVAFMIFVKFQGMISIVSVAASNILFSTLSMAFLPGYAFGVAATTLLGQAMGARKYKLAYHAAFRSAFFSAHVMGLVGLAFIIFGRNILNVYTQDMELIEECYPALVLLGVIQIGDAYHMVIGAALRGAGLQAHVFRIYMLVTYLIMLPCAYLFGIYFKGGTLGIWAAIFIWIATLSGTFVLEFRRKKWVKGTV